MKRILSRRPSPAVIIAIVALVAALGGTAIAGGGFLPKTKFQRFKKNTNTTLGTTLKGPVTYVNQTESVNTTAATSGVNITAVCPAGTKAVGGGAKSSTPSATSNVFVENSYPSATGWTALVFAGLGPPPGTPEQITVTAICVTGSSSGTPPTITP
jgi:hypothetical protein